MSGAEGLLVPILGGLLGYGASLGTKALDEVAMEPVKKGVKKLYGDEKTPPTDLRTAVGPQQGQSQPQQMGDPAIAGRGLMGGQGQGLMPQFQSTDPANALAGQLSMPPQAQQAPQQQMSPQMPPSQQTPQQGLGGILGHQNTDPGHTHKHAMANSIGDALVLFGQMTSPNGNPGAAMQLMQRRREAQANQQQAAHEAQMAQQQRHEDIQREQQNRSQDIALHQGEVQQKNAFQQQQFQYGQQQDQLAAQREAQKMQMEQQQFGQELALKQQLYNHYDQKDQMREAKQEAKQQEAQQATAAVAHALFPQEMATANAHMQRSADTAHLQNMSTGASSNMTPAQGSMPPGMSLNSQQLGTPPGHPMAMQDLTARAKQLQDMGLELLHHNPDGTVRIRDPQTGRMGTWHP